LFLERLGLGCKLPSNSPGITDYRVILPIFGGKVVLVDAKLLSNCKKIGLGIRVINETPTEKLLGKIQ
jgi:hypothetical protein